MPKNYDKESLIGKRFNRLTILEITEPYKSKKYCITLCDCGNIKEHLVESLKSGGTKSCGCLRTESNLTGNNRRKHGLIHHPLYQVWTSMKDRCYCKSDAAYVNYGALGARVCDEWLNDFKAFYDWAISNGWEKGLHIDKDKHSKTIPGKLYSPKFCCFLTRTENMKYRRNSIILEYNMETKYLIDWCQFLGLDRLLIKSRLSQGWDVKRAFETKSLGNYKRKGDIV